jgi:hypothetical protein
VAYEAFVKDYEDLRDGAELVLTIRDLTPGRRKYNARIVRAKVRRAAGSSGTADLLWVRAMVGRKFPDAWELLILEELGPDAPGRPYDDIFEAIGRLRPQANVAT